MIRASGRLAVAALATPLAVLAARPAPLARADTPVAIAIVSDVRDSMNAIWRRGNEHWNELSDQNTLTQMLGTGKPTQREYLGCLHGRIDGDTLRITGWAPARDMKQLQFAVTGTCDSVPDLVGTFHTHPYRADSVGRALKEPGASAQDLATFAAGRDRALVVVWDVDSADAALRTANGVVVHPASLAWR